MNELGKTGDLPEAPTDFSVEATQDIVPASDLGEAEKTWIEELFHRIY